MNLIKITKKILENIFRIWELKKLLKKMENVG
jgi:hypothetical protein